MLAEVETTREGAVLSITLNRADVLNAFNAALHTGLAAALKEARRPEVRAVVITGAGRGFCVGQDLTEFREASGDIGSRLRETYHLNVLAIRALEKPVIAAVNGAAAGAGMGSHLRGRRARRAGRSSCRGCGTARRAADARRRDDEAPDRSRPKRDAGTAARTGGRAADSGNSDG